MNWNRKQKRDFGICEQRPDILRFTCSRYILLFITWSTRSDLQKNDQHTQKKIKRVFINVVEPQIEWTCEVCCKAQFPVFSPCVQSTKTTTKTTTTEPMNNKYIPYQASQTRRSDRIFQNLHDYFKYWRAVNWFLVDYISQTLRPGPVFRPSARKDWIRNWSLYSLDVKWNISVQQIYMAPSNNGGFEPSMFGYG